MASKNTTEIVGFPEIIATLKQLPNKFGVNGARGAIFQTGKKAAEMIQQSAPVRTGQLKASISVSRGRLRRGGLIHSMIKGLFYAKFLEKGTKFMPAKAFLFPTIERNASELIKIFAEEMGKALKKQYKKYSKTLVK